MMRTILLLTAALLPALAAEVKRPKILGVAHLAVRVSDIEKSRAFYKDFLGYAEPFSLKNADGSLSLTFIKINDHQYVELFPGLAPEQDRLHHISIYTDDAEGMRKYLASRGIKVPERVPKGRIGNSNFNVKDPDGHTLEIVQYEPDGWSMREKGRHMGESRISERILHVGIIVGSVEASMRFYRDLLGFREIWRGSRSGTELQWINMQVPDGSDYIEFMLYREQPAPNARGSQHHMCLVVPDMAASLKRLESRPDRASYTRPLEIRTGTNRKRQLNIFDPDGTRVELMEPHTVDGKPAPSSTAPPPRP
ncbi:MAG: VOC family protein [Acidobacteria bacterium]|nr:VOC family protein [Acidobacteriota bacterium]MBI3278948.1 VOC family protein [Acidobacteriota bacterium]